jgi:hypothetical protein
MADSGNHLGRRGTCHCMYCKGGAVGFSHAVPRMYSPARTGRVYSDQSIAGKKAVTKFSRMGRAARASPGATSRAHSHPRVVSTIGLEGLHDALLTPSCGLAIPSETFCYYGIRMAASWSIYCPFHESLPGSRFDHPRH